MDRMNVYEKLQVVQERLKAPKSQYNVFGKYHYRNCEDIQEAAKPLLKEVRAALIVGDRLVVEGERYYIEATARFIDCETGEQVENVAYAREEREKKGMDASQVTGSASSYARKYALNGLFCIDDVKDADSQDYTGKSSQAAKSGAGRERKAETGQPAGAASSAKITPEEMESVRMLVEKHSAKGLKMEKILKMYQIKDIAEMSADQYKDCMNKLKLYEKEEPAHE